MGQIDGFGNRTTDKWLCSGHHANMTMSMNKPFSFFSAFVGTIKYGKMLVFKERSSFNSHSATNKIIGCFNLFIGESKCFEQAPFKIEILFGLETKPTQTFFPEIVYIK